MKTENILKNSELTRDADMNLWLSPIDPQFNDDMFLYHYTNFETACKILYSESLRFSSLSKTNDTVEAKLKIKTKNAADEKTLKDIIEIFERINKSNIQLLCFSKDYIDSKIKKSAKTITGDLSGRGFALPRMWAQYGENNNGVCFIINKQKFINKINNTKRLKKKVLHNDDVKYKSVFIPYIIESDEINELKDYFSNPDDKILNYGFFIDNEEFIKYNYFNKSTDWIQEREYRFLAYDDSPLFIGNLKEYLVGIVIGEKMEDVNEKIMHNLSKCVCKEIKKIKFNYNGCKLTNLSFKGFDVYEEE